MKRTKSLNDIDDTVLDYEMLFYCMASEEAKKLRESDKSTDSFYQSVIRNTLWARNVSTPSVDPNAETKDTEKEMVQGENKC